MLLRHRSSTKVLLLTMCTNHIALTSRVGFASSCKGGELAFLPKRIRKLLFGEPKTAVAETPPREKKLRPLNITSVQGELSLAESITFAVNKYKFAPPHLVASTMNLHFEKIAYEQTETYRLMLEEFIKSNSLPTRPIKWKKRLGWTKYTESGVSSVPFPDCDVLVFDVEVCCNEGDCPVIAVAASSDAWYSWCSPMLIAKTNEEIEAAREFNLRNLIPLESKLDEPLTSMKSAKRLVIGHNVSYDRRRVREQYAVEKTPLRFLDTMSLHIAVCGYIGEQRMYVGSAGGSGSPELIEDYDSPDSTKAWSMQGATNSLLKVWNYHCPNSNLKIEKETRNIFVVGTLEDVHKDFQHLMDYCANDVAATSEIICAIWPKFCERIPHPVTLAGMLDMGLMYLPVNYMWRKFLENCRDAYEKQQSEMADILAKLAENACAFATDEKYRADPWLFDLEWSLPKTNNSMKLPAWFRKLCVGQHKVAPECVKPKVSTTMDIVPKLLRMTWCGYPLYKSSAYGWGYLVPDESIGSWSIGQEFDGFTKLEDGLFEMQIEEAVAEKQVKDGTEENQVENPIKHKQAEKTIEGQAENTIQGQVANAAEGEAQAKITHFPFEAIVAAVKETKSRYCYDKLSEDKIHVNKEPFASVKLPGCSFYKLPHKGGKNCNVGSPLTKDFLCFMTENLPRLVSADPEVLNKLALITRISSYWKSNQSRIMEEAFAILHERDIPAHVKRSDEYSADKLVGAILPQTIVSGTVTRRAVERTWLTAANPKADAIGSELKAMVHAPPGYVFVGADVDVQEMWIAAMFGDGRQKHYGSSPFSRMLIDGDKAKGTDYHSYIAEQIGIKRTPAKILNYARMYGGGVSSAATYLQIYGLSEKEAKEKAEKLYVKTKGYPMQTVSVEALRNWNPYGRINEVSGNRAVITKAELAKMAKQLQKKEDEISLGRQWFGGTESDIFNFLEDLVATEQPRTPVLKCCISRTLEPKYVGKQFLTSRINWVIQSSGVDYLHLLITAMNWLMDKYIIKGRLSISIHDEVHYIVKKEDAYRAALALQTANLMTRAMFAEALGFNDLPLSVAFFSSVEIDRVLRKEVGMECVTPSNAGGLMKTYGIPHGEALTIEALLEKTEGSLFPPQTAPTQNNPSNPEVVNLSESGALSRDLSNSYSEHDAVTNVHAVSSRI